MSIFNLYSKINKDRIAVIDDNNNQLKYSDLSIFAKEIKSIIPERSLVFCLCNNLLSIYFIY